MGFPRGAAGLTPLPGDALPGGGLCPFPARCTGPPRGKHPKTPKNTTLAPGERNIPPPSTFPRQRRSPSGGAGRRGGAPRMRRTRPRPLPDLPGRERGVASASPPRPPPLGAEAPPPALPARGARRRGRPHANTGGGARARGAEACGARALPARRADGARGRGATAPAANPTAGFITGSAARRPRTAGHFN